MTDSVRKVFTKLKGIWFVYQVHFEGCYSNLFFFQVHIYVDSREKVTARYQVKVN